MQKSGSLSESQKANTRSASVLYKPPSGREGDRDSGGGSPRYYERKHSILSESQNSNLRFYSAVCQSHYGAGSNKFLQAKICRSSTHEKSVKKEG